MKITELPEQNVVLFESAKYRICGKVYRGTKNNHLIIKTEKKKEDAVGSPFWHPEGDIWFSTDLSLNDSRREDNSFQLNLEMGNISSAQVFLINALPEILEMLLNSCI